MNATDIIIKCLDEESEYTCRKSPCDLPEKEGNTGECCHKCSLAILAEHDAEIIQATLRKVEQAMYSQCFEKDNAEDMQKWDSGNWFRYKLFENVMAGLKGGEG